MKELDVLDRLSQVSGKNDKRQILKDNATDNRLADLLDASLNFFRKFHVHKFEMPTNIVGSEMDLHQPFLNLLLELEQRTITGNEAKSRVEAFFTNCSKRQRDWYSKVLRKDLKIGISVDTAAEVFAIPTFDVMLATDGKKCKQLHKIISQGVYVSPKLDGYRCLAVINNGDVTLYSRNGSEFDNFPSIKESLAKSFEGRSLVLDGEIMSDDFQAMQQTAFASKRGTSVGDVKYNVFDCITLIEWKSGDFQLKKSVRYANLTRISSDFNSDVQLVKQELTTDLNRILQLEVDYMALGFEGAMVIPDIPYYKGRSSNKLMKFKTMQSQDCTVTGFYEGKEGTRNEGRMGGIQVIQENGVACECGTGFSDEVREHMWNNQSEFISRIAEIKYQELTKDGVMRFPVFMRWRDQGKGTGKI